MKALLKHRNVVSIVGDIARVETGGVAAHARPRLAELALIFEGEGEDAPQRLAQVTRIDGSVAALQVFGGAAGLSNRSRVVFLGRHLETACSSAVLGRVLNGRGAPIDGRPSLDLATRVSALPMVVNPARRVLASRMIRTDMPMIDVFNSLVESQKIPIFSVHGEPYNALLARIGAQADTDVVVFAGIGLAYDDFHEIRSTLANSGALAHSVMFVNLADDPILERLITPDLALAVADHFAFVERKRVLVLISDMTAFADALREVGVSMDRIPAHRGHMGDLYSQLARRYERACDYKDEGSLTMVTVTTMPGHDVTHPAPDNTGYITEGQIYLHGGRIDPFGSLSRLKQHVVGKQTREDHPAIMNTMIRLYAEAGQARQKAAMGFDLGDYDERLLGFAGAFETAFMRWDAAMALEPALDLAWRLLARWFTPAEIRIKPALMQRYLPADATPAQGLDR